MSILALLAVTLAVAFGTPFPASAQTTSHRELARDILAELIAIRTVAGTGTTVEAAEAMATRLKDAGFSAEDVLVIGPEPGLGNVVARFRGKGSGGRPILTMAHLDVVDALSEDWSMDPYELIERDGYFYGRGTSDNKAGAATLVANFIRLKKEGFIPDRDLIMVLTADEESTQASIRWLAEERLDLVDAELALNTDGGFGDIQNGKRIRLSLQASEKVYLSFRLEVINKGGHSSRPVPDNAIYHLARGLTGLADFEFPVKLNEVTRAFFEKSAELASGQVASDMKAILTSPPDSGAASRLAESPYYNGGTRAECASPNRAGRRQLSDSTGRIARRGRAHIEPGGGRSANRHHPDRRADCEPALSPFPPGGGDHRTPRQPAFPRSAGGAGHVHRGHRRTLRP
jgi:acetylornithine deacetylase/succinyl-diaminopimelate desuccinylase-like protein